MLDFRIAEILTEDRPNKYWYMLRNIGINDAVGILPRHFSDWRMHGELNPWDYISLKRYKNMINDSGFNLVAIEDNPPMDKIILNLDGKDDELENVARMIENFGKLNIKIWCYNWMAVIGWFRSSTHILKDYGTTSGFNENDINDYNFNVRINKSDLWKNLNDFLDFIVPIAEDNDVKLAMHPDDPPLDNFSGIPRIMNSIESYDHLIELNKSDYNGITMCQGNFTLMADNLPDVIKHFNKKIFFVHFRDVLGDRHNFIETLIGHGKTDLYKCMKAYNDINFDGIMRVDHVPTLYSDDASVPGYSYLNRLYAIGYINGLRDSIKNGSKTR
ncbi:mannonate dehydratase [Picrophilus oshimae]|uniref:mannonate dehydratase n=1 Tax=Picrophilus torridus (strain ATCC 700027 / DSM 9790 / JCM 10055 / NBRC 100828 / KAW 2/3) TaxID=1122961 RepID=Q6L2R9_PICTO|nr:mannonate dehydratase [Picrophilus oshimae]AAT42733.1 mannonate dehydratase [Picrophilus oshimae DSM 9789]